MAPPRLEQLHNPPNPFHGTEVEWLGPAPDAETTVYQERPRSILSRNDSPDIPFTWSLNPYRGCGHACAYCYARPTHEYLDLGAGTDFDRRLVVKSGAAEVLRATFDHRSWRGELIAFSGNTDCYQPLEASHGLTRACLEVCLAYRNPVSIITKSALIARDVELLAELHRAAHCHVMVSIPFHRPDAARAIEPGAPKPAQRYQTIHRLSEAGVPTGVNVAPVIPGLNDSEVPAILEAARAAGARFFGTTLIRRPGSVAEVFERRLRHAFPDRADRVLNQIDACRAEPADERRFGRRMRGGGQRWLAIEGLIDNTARRLGYQAPPPPPTPSPFRRPERGGQLDLFAPGPAGASPQPTWASAVDGGARSDK